MTNADAPTTVVILRYTHKHGDNLTAHFTEADAHVELLQTAEQEWHELACVNGSTCGVSGCSGLPASPDPLTDAEIISAYFNHRPDEDYELVTHQIEPRVAGVIARLAGRPGSSETTSPAPQVETLTKRIELALRYLADNEDGSYTATVIEVLRGERTA